MKINKPLIFALLIVLGIIIAVWLVKRTGLGPDSGVNQFFNTPVDNGVDQEFLVENYLRENISQLSPEPEVLGGTFYVTNLEFLEENSVKVEYEDGHIALVALATYSLNANNEVLITDFTVLPEEPYQRIEIEDNSLVSTDQEFLVENYLRENISQLSPEPEVLGGTFYVTNLEFLEENSVKVEYEDGHIALVALATYSVNGGLVEINSFELID